MFYRYYTYTKVKDILRTFEPDNHKMLRTSQPQNFFAGPYKKKVYGQIFRSLVHACDPDWVGGSETGISLTFWDCQGEQSLRRP